MSVRPRLIAWIVCVALAAALWGLLASRAAAPADASASAQDQPAAPRPLETLGCSVEGLGSFQRRYPAGHSSWVTALRYAVYPVGGSDPVEQGQARSDAQGVFYFYITDPGVYDIGVKPAHALEQRKAQVTIVRGYNPDVSFGLFLEGDADDSNAVNAADYGVLAGAFWGSDARADFNVDGLVDILDYSLLYTHYEQVGPRPAYLAAADLTSPSAPLPAEYGAERGAAAPPRRVPVERRLGGEVNIPSTVVSLGDVFDLAIAAQGLGAVDGLEARLSFDPAILRVVDAPGQEAGAVIPGGALGQVIRNSADNGAGQIRYAAGAALGGGAPSADFTLATIRFQAVGLSAGSTVAINHILAARGGGALEAAATNGVVQVVEPTPTPTPYEPALTPGTSTATPTATRTPSVTPTPSRTATPSITVTTSATPTRIGLSLPLIARRRVWAR